MRNRDIARLVNCLHTQQQPASLHQIMLNGEKAVLLVLKKKSSDQILSINNMPTEHYCLGLDIKWFEFNFPVLINICTWFEKQTNKQTKQNNTTQIKNKIQKHLLKI